MSISRKNVPRVFLFEALVGLHFFSGVLIPFYTEWGGIRLREVMILNALFSVMLAAFEIPTGVLADKFGRKPALMGAAACVGFAAFLYTRVPNFWIFMLAEIPWAFGVALASGADQALLFDSLKADGQETVARKVIGQTSALGMLALAVAAPIGSLMGEAWGLRAPMLAVMVPSALAIWVAGTMIEPPRHDVGEKARRLTVWQMLQEGFSLLSRHRQVRWLLAEQMTATVPCSFIIWTYQFRLKELGVSMGSYGWAHMAMCLAQVLILAQPLWVERRVGGTRRYFLFSALLPAVCFLSLGGLRHLGLNMLAIVLIAGFGLSRQRFISGHLQTYIPSDIRATAQSGVNMLSRVLVFIFNPLVGWAAENSLSTVYWVLGAFMLTARLWVRAPASSVPETSSLNA